MKHNIDYLKIANDVKKCKIDDNNCMIETANEIVQKYSRGYEILGLQSFDPLKIGKMDIVQGNNAAVQIDLALRQVECLGLSKAKVYKISGFEKDPEGNRLDIRFKTPLATVFGSYVGPNNFNGQLLVLPIHGNGNITLKLPNLDVQMKFLTTKFVIDGQTFMKIDKVKLKYEFAR